MGVAAECVIQAHEADDSLDSLEYEKIGRVYEELLSLGFAQVAHQVKDILLYGDIRPETQHRSTNEIAGQALEKLGKPFVTCFNYSLINSQLVAEDGEVFVSFNKRGVHEIEKAAKVNPDLLFLVQRRRADKKFAKSLEALALNPSIEAGSCLVVGSACANADELGIPEKLLVDYHFQTEKDQAMVWIGTKTEDGIKLQTINLFHADPTVLTQAISMATSRPAASCSREESPWNHTRCRNEGDLAEKIRDSFDSLLTERRQEQTFHGLTKSEIPDFVSAESLLTHSEFEKARIATEERFAEISYSIAKGKLALDASYIEAVLNLKKPDGSFELEGEKRTALHRVLFNKANRTDFLVALRVLQDAATISLWAELSGLYHGDSRRTTHATDSSDSSVGVSIGNLQTITQQRSQGRQDYGCPGGGDNQTKDQSVFNMSSNDVLKEMFGGVKIIKTNCPMCETKNVTAEIASGKITCKSCSACVEICTGKVLAKSRKQNKTKEYVGMFTGARKQRVEKGEFKFFEFKKPSRHKPDKREKIAA